MLSKSKVKYIRSLEMKKYRNEYQTFVAEGNKMVSDMMGAFPCELIIAKPSWMATQGNIPAKELLEADDDDLRKASFLKTPQDVLAVFKQPEYRLEDVCPSQSLVLALDGVQDPGNHHTDGRLVRDRAHCLQYGYGRRIQSQGSTSHHGRPVPCAGTLYRSGSLS